MHLIRLQEHVDPHFNRAVGPDGPANRAKDIFLDSLGAARLSLTQGFMAGEYFHRRSIAFVPIDFRPADASISFVYEMEG